MGNKRRIEKDFPKSIMIIVLLLYVIKLCLGGPFNTTDEMKLSNDNKHVNNLRPNSLYQHEVIQNAEFINKYGLPCIPRNSTDADCVSRRQYELYARKNIDRNALNEMRQQKLDYMTEQWKIAESQAQALALEGLSLNGHHFKNDELGTPNELKKQFKEEKLKLRADKKNKVKTEKAATKLAVLEIKQVKKNAVREVKGKTANEEKVILDLDLKLLNDPRTEKKNKDVRRSAKLQKKVAKAELKDWRNNELNF